MKTRNPLKKSEDWTATAAEDLQRAGHLWKPDLFESYFVRA